MLIIIVWVVGFVIGEAVPFFGDLLSLISSLFDSFFGLIFCKFLHSVLLYPVPNTYINNRGICLHYSQQG